MKKIINNWTPLHSRILGHRLGDGSVNFYGNVNWDNTRPFEFINLCRHLEIQIWKPVVSGNCYKITIPKFLFESYAVKYGYDYNCLIKNPVELVKTFLDKDFDDKLQVLCACMFDDGTCKAWRPILFEDQNCDLSEMILSLWNSAFGFGAKIDYKTITKAGTRIYHVVLSRDAFVAFYEKIEEAKNKFGELAGLWQKEPDAKWRYEKATSKKALILLETKNLIKERIECLIEFLTNNIEGATFGEIKSHFKLTSDRTRNIINKCIENQKIELIGKFRGSFYKII